MVLTPVSQSHSLASTFCSPPPPPEAQLHVAPELMCPIPASYQLFSHLTFWTYADRFIAALQRHNDCHPVAAGAPGVDSKLLQGTSDPRLASRTQTSARNERAARLPH